MNSMNVLYLFVFACIIVWLPLTSKTISSDTSNKQYFRLDSSLRNRLILPDAAFDNVLISGEKNSATSNLGKSSFFFYCYFKLPRNSRYQLSGTRFTSLIRLFFFFISNKRRLDKKVRVFFTFINFHSNDDDLVICVQVMASSDF